MQNNHTPGPYHVGQGKAAVIIYDPNGNAIADAKTFHGKHEQGQAAANARLLAAASDMLEALEAIFRECALAQKYWGDGANGRQCDAARKAGLAAIAKARGEEVQHAHS